MANEGNKAIVRRWYDEFWNDGKLEAADQLLHPDYVYQDGYGTGAPSVAANKQGHAIWHRILPDMHFTIEDMIAEGEDLLPRKEVLMTTQEIVAFVRRGYDAYNAHLSDPHWFDYATEDVAEECEVVDIPSGMILRGPEGLKQFLLGFSTAFPDSHVEVTNVSATEEHAVVEASLRGTHTGMLHSPAGDIPPTGQKLELHACDVYQLRNRKIVRHASYYDALGFKRCFACGSIVLLFYLYFVFALAERKNEIQKKEKYHCE